MKYWAILKDSFREAIDTKVLYVMVGLSLLVTLVVASMSFEPLPARTLMQGLVTGHMSWMAMVGPGAQAERQRAQEQRMAEENAQRAKGFHDFAFVGVEAIKGPADSPDSEYATTIELQLSSAAEAEKIRKAPDETFAMLRKRFALVEEYGLIRVTKVRLAGLDAKNLAKNASSSPKNVYFVVTTHPTDATRRLWPHEPSIFFGALELGGDVPLGIQLYLIAQSVMDLGSFFAIIVSVIITAFFIPNMLRKGTVDLLLVKPIHRWSLLLYKYIGGLTFIFLNTTLAIVGMWLALGLRSGIWANTFLLMIFVITFYFAILYAVSALFGVLTQSSITAILITCGAWLIFTVVGSVYQVLEIQKTDNAFTSVVRTVHFVLPRTADLGRLRNQMLISDFLTGKLGEGARLDPTSITWGESLTVSGVFIALMLGLACWRFATKDY
jgi:ABC-type transport system involved in multi-copper enzyme maturation permease subunit